MNEHKKINKMLTDFALGELSKQQTSQVNKHLAECDMCSSELKQIKALLNYTEKVTKLSANEKICESAKLEILQTVEFEKTQQTPRANITLENIRNTIMKNPIIKFGTIAATIAILALPIILWEATSNTAYAINQTVEAFENIRFIHLKRFDDTGQIEDERWIEIGMNGRQVRYRQENPPNFLVIEDKESTAEYHNDKQTVVIYDKNDKQYQWVGNWGVFLENLLQKGQVVEENDYYNGQHAHKVLWPMFNAECYIDPQTKLPLTIGAYTEVSYEIPSEETFEIFIPEGFTLVDKRPGSEAVDEPEWLKADTQFNQAKQALANKNYSKATELLEFVVEHQSKRNWAWFWLGKAYYELGDYSLAIEKFSKVIEIFGDTPCIYCNYARSLAYAKMGNYESALDDIEICLPWMILALRDISAASMFEYADYYFLGSYNPTESEIISHMINRLRVVSGQNFGYNPDATKQENENAISAWEQWFETNGQIMFTFDIELIEVGP